MKKLMIGLLVATMAASSWAGLYVAWDGYGFSSGKDSGLGIMQDKVTKNVIWELVWTTATGTPNVSWDKEANDRKLGDGDVEISVRTLTPKTPSGDVYGEAVVVDNLSNSLSSPSPVEVGDYGWDTTGESFSYANPEPEAKYKGGNLYAAVFQYTTDNKVYFATTDIIEGVNWDCTPTDPTGVAKVHFDFGKPTALDFLGEVSTIPEPATMSLLGLGALAMVLRRKLRK